MPSSSRKGVIATVINGESKNPSSSKAEKIVGFYKDPVSSVSRPLNPEESWAAYDFEMHARTCAYCHDPAEVHRSRAQLCEPGHRLAQEVAAYIYQEADGEIYSTVEEGNKLVRVELPAGYPEVRGLLKAIERSLRHRSRTPFISMDRSYQVASRMPPIARGNKEEQAESRSRPRSDVIIDSPKATQLSSKTLTEVNSTGLKWGNLYEEGFEWDSFLDEGLEWDSLHKEDVVAQRRRAKRYHAEVRQPAFLKEVKEVKSGTLVSKPFHNDETQVEIGQPPKIEGQLGVAQLEETVAPDPLLGLRENNSSSSPSSESGAYHPHKDMPWDFVKSFSEVDNQSSVASSNAGSIFSIASLASSASDLSKASGYSATQIASATRELLLILRDDEVLQPLYKTAIEGDIGPERFVNNFRRLLKIYAENLKEEARDRIDFLAARLVAVKARHLAESILKKFRPAPTFDPPHSKAKEKFAQEDSSEDEDDDNTEDDTIFQDLVIAREFLVESHAFDNLRSRFRAFVLSPRASTKKPTTKGKERALIQADDGYSGKAIGGSVVAALSNRLDQDEAGDLTARRFANAFVRDPELHILHKAAMLELGKETFVANYTRILRLYFKDLDEKTTPETTGRAIIQELRKRSNVKIIVNTTIDNIIAAETLNHIETNDRALLQNDSSTMTTWLVEQQQRRVEGGQEGGNLRLLPFYNGFLQQDIAFRKLALNIRLLSLPTSLREIVETIPKNLLKLSSTHNTSVINRLKGFAEDRITLEWDWWPMGPRVPNPQPGTRRLEWKYCEQPLYHIVSEAHADILQEVLDNMSDHPPHCHCRHCDSDVRENAYPFVHSVMATLLYGLPNALQKKLEASSASWAVRSQAKEPKVKLSPLKGWRMSGNTIMSGNPPVKEAPGNPSARAQPSKASARYTPGSSLTQDSKTPGAEIGRQNAGSVPSGSSNNASPQIRGKTPTIRPPVTSTWILFGIQGRRWSLELEQIAVSDIINDPTFFRELKARYKRHRGWLKILLSPFRFQFCRFVKFEKFDADRVISQGDDLPDYHGFQHDYDYAPRPGKNPLINPKTFAICLKACDPQSCIWARLNPWHDCIRLPCRSDRVRCIPKKKSRFDMASEDVGILAWGLEADYALSFAFLAVYHLVPVLAALGFWVYWLRAHPGDWQNSSVPILTVLALFAAFWMPFAKQFGVA